MEKKIKTDELRARDAELVRVACITTNLAYTLVEVADSMIADVNNKLRNVGAQVSKQELAKFNNVVKTGKRFRVWLKDLSKQIYNLDIAEDALDDSDNIYDFMMLILDRCGGDMEELGKMKKMILDNFESRYKIYNTYAN